MSKKFEYELTLRLEKAEKAIASLASKIEKDLNKAVETAFKGSSEFDFSPHKENLKEMVRYANMLNENQKEAAEYTLRLERERLQSIKEAISWANEFNQNRVAAEQRTLELEKQRTAELAQQKLQDIRGQVQSEVDTRAGQAILEKQVAQEKLQLIRQTVQAEVDQRVGRKLLADLTESSDRREIELLNEKKQKEADYAKEREAKTREDLKAVEEHNRWVTKNAKDSADAAKIESDNADEHIRRLSDINKMVKEYQANYKDPSAQAAIQQTSDKLAQLSQNLQTSGESVVNQRKLMAEGMKAGKENLDAQLSQIKSVSQAEIDANARSTDRIRNRVESEKSANSVRYANHKLILQHIDTAEQQLAADLAAIEAQSTTLTKAEYNERLRAHQQMRSAILGAAIEAGAVAEANANRIAGAGARGVAAVFQVQQAVEDSMYAGLRGAANNIAFLLTSIANPWVAIGGLIAVASLQLASHLGLTEKLNEQMGELLWKSEARLEIEKKNSELIMETMDAEVERKRELAKFNAVEADTNKLQSAVETKQRELDIEMEYGDQLRKRIDLYMQAKKAAANMPGVDLPGLQSMSSLFGGAEKPEDLLKGKGNTNVGGKVSALFGFSDAEELARYTTELEKLVEIEQQYVDLSGEHSQLNELEFEANKKKLEEQEKLVREKAAELGISKEQLDLALNVRDISREIKALNEFDPFAGLSKLGHDAEKAASSMKKFGQEERERLAEEQAQAQEKLALDLASAKTEEQKQLIREKSREFAREQARELRELIEKEKAYAEEISRRVDVVNKAIDRAERLIEIEKDRLKIAKDVVRETEKEMAAQDKIIENAQKQIDKLKEEQSIREDKNAKRDVGMKNDIIEANAKDEIKAIDKVTDAQKAAIQREYEIRKKWADAHAQYLKKNGFDKSDVESQHNAFNRQLEDQKDAMLKALDEQKKLSNDKVNEKVANEKQKNLDAMEALQKQKAAALKDEVNAKAGNKDFEGAIKAGEKLKSVLEEIQAAKEQAFGAAGTGKEKEGLMKQIQDLDPQIKEANKQLEQVQADQLKAAKQQKADLAIEHAQEQLRQAEIEKGLELMMETKNALQNMPVVGPLDLGTAGQLLRAMQAITAEKARAAAININGGAAGGGAAGGGAAGGGAAGPPLIGPQPVPGMGVIPGLGAGPGGGALTVVQNFPQGAGFSAAAMSAAKAASLNFRLASA